MRAFLLPLFLLNRMVVARLGVSSHRLERSSNASVAAIGQPGGAWPRIVGGSPAAPGAYPWHAIAVIARIFANGTRDNAVGICGATLINSRFALSAAHCVCDFLAADPGNTVITNLFFGGTALNGNDAIQTARAADEHCHPGYDPDSQTPFNDIMVYELPL